MTNEGPGRVFGRQTPIRIYALVSKTREPQNANGLLYLDLDAGTMDELQASVDKAAWGEWREGLNGDLSRPVDLFVAPRTFKDSSQVSYRVLGLRSYGAASAAKAS